MKAISDRVAVMYLGRLCEVGPSEQLFAHLAHPYTALLLAAILVPADQRCANEVPELRLVAPGQYAACHHSLM